MSDVNIPLLRKAVEWAEAEAAKPSELCEWEQRYWRIEPDDNTFARHYRKDRAPECGTTYCIAGYVCEVINADTWGGWAMPAANALGIDYDECGSGLTDGELLFHAGNSIEDVRRIAEEIAGERL